MDKYIKAQDLIDRIYPVDPENDGSDGCTVVYKSLTLSSPEIEAIVEELPAADVVPVVRCLECKHYKEHRTKKYGNLICRCTRMGKYDMDYPVKPDDFCSYGERRETNEN